jgi:hypothetical protein
MKIGGNRHVAPPQHGQEDYLGAIGQPALGRTGPTEVLKGTAFLGGDRDGHGGRRTFSTSSDRCIHGR